MERQPAEAFEVDGAMFFVPVVCRIVYGIQLRRIRAEGSIRIVIVCEFHPFGDRVPIVSTESVCLIRAVPSPKLTIGFNERFFSDVVYSDIFFVPGAMI